MKNDKCCICARNINCSWIMYCKQYLFTINPKCTRMTQQYTVCTLAVITKNGPGIMDAVLKACWAHYLCFANTVFCGEQAQSDLLRYIREAVLLLPFSPYCSCRHAQTTVFQKQKKAPEQTSQFQWLRQHGTVHVGEKEAVATDLTPSSYSIYSN